MSLRLAQNAHSLLLLGYVLLAIRSLGAISFGRARWDRGDEGFLGLLALLAGFLTLGYGELYLFGLAHGYTP